jgi:hypothetical protein
MRLNLVLGGLLLMATPVLFAELPPSADPRERDGKVVWFDLSEGPEAVATQLGRPANVVDFGQHFQSWQYQIGNADHHEFSHEVVFRKPGNTLISITRNYEPEENVDRLFPPAQTRSYFYPDGGRPKYAVRVRRLAPGILLLAMGTSAPGQRTGQIVLIRESELRYFHRWLFDQLPKGTEP